MDNKPRDIKTLLLLVLVHIDQYIPAAGGLCLMYTHMQFDKLITGSEYDKLYFYTLEYRPKPINDYDGYFFPMGDIKQRKDFIENLISKL